MFSGKTTKHHHKNVQQNQHAKRAPLKVICRTPVANPIGFEVGRPDAQAAMKDIINIVESPCWKNA